MTQIKHLSALDLGEKIRNEELSSVAVTSYFLDQIAEHNDTVGAFITVAGDQALAAATQADVDIAAGRELGPLHGVPCPVKDLDPVAGIRCTFGSAVMADYVPDEDGAVAARVRAAGMIILGKTNTPEFGFPCYTENAIAPPARTPWDLSRSAGGSSGGAATAVASGLAPVAQGSDGGGSIRNPASVCGLVGVKPSRGRISNGAAAILGNLGTSGVLAKTVADAAAFLDAVAGPLEGDIGYPDSGDFLQALDAEWVPQRIAWSDEPMIAAASVNSACLAATAVVREILTAAGCELIEIPPPISPEATKDFEVVWQSIAAGLPLPAQSQDQLMPLTQYLVSMGQKHSGPEVALAVTRLQQHGFAINTALSEFDAFLTPTLAQLPALVGELRNDSDPAADFAAQKEWTPFTAPFNVSGQPAISLPVYQHQGLPVGVQLAGRWGQEAPLFRLAREVETQVNWIESLAGVML